MDNLGAHRGDRVRKLVERSGCSLLYLPPYSPDFSPIEEAFSKVKSTLKEGTGAHQRGPCRSDRSGSRYDQLHGHPRLLHRLWIPSTCAVVVKTALECDTGEVRRTPLLGSLANRADNTSYGRRWSRRRVVGALGDRMPPKPVEGCMPHRTEAMPDADFGEHPF
jgi:hypothetical protein